MPVDLRVAVEAATKAAVAFGVRSVGAPLVKVADEVEDAFVGHAPDVVPARRERIAELVQARVVEVRVGPNRRIATEKARDAAPFAFVAHARFLCRAAIRVSTLTIRALAGAQELALRAEAFARFTASAGCLRLRNVTLRNVFLLSLGSDAQTFDAFVRRVLAFAAEGIDFDDECLKAIHAEGAEISHLLRTPARRARLEGHGVSPATRRRREDALHGRFAACRQRHAHTHGSPPTHLSCVRPASQARKRAKPLVMWVDHAQRAIARMLDRKGFRSRFAKTALGKSHYYELKGSGPRGTIVLQHGIASSGAAFAPLAGSLAKAFERVVILDAPGHGLSDAPAGGLTPEGFYQGVVQALDEVVPERFVLVGNSLGGAAALRFASTVPARLRATVVCSPGGAPTTDEDFQQLVRGFRAETHREAMAFARRLYHVAPWHLPVSAAFIGGLLRRPPIREFFKAVSSADMLEPGSLQSIAAPLLFIWGKGERLLPDTHREFFLEHLPKHAVFEFPERYGHVPQAEHPRDLAERIVRFVSVEFT